MTENRLTAVDMTLADGAELLSSLGSTISSPALRDRFLGVREDILREIRGGMCTLEQGYAYLENFEMRLLAEQWSELEASVAVG